MADDATGVKDMVETDTTIEESPTTETNDDGIIVIGEDSSSRAADEEDSQEKATSEKDTDEALSQGISQAQETRPKNAETRSQQLNREIRDKVAERNALREEIAELSRQKYNLKSAQDIPTVDSLLEQINPNTGDYYTRAEAESLRINQRLDAMEEQRAFNEYVERVADSRIQLSNEANQVVKDFPIFDPDSDQYNAELTAAADDLMKNSLIVDEKTGQVIGSRISPYKLYSLIANAEASGKAGGKTSGRKAALEMLNNADVVGTSGNGSADSDEDDPFLKGFSKSDY